jgi:hypothetical protein
VTTASHPGVVALVETARYCGEQSKVVCTGSLIAPRVVLTAAHCLELAAPGAFAVSFGPNVVDGERVPVLAQRAHPAYQGREHDLGLLYLSRAPRDTLAVPLATGPLNAESRQELMVIGYGLDDRGELGAKRIGHSRLDAGVTRVVGVATGGDPEYERTSLYARLDADHDFVTTTLREWSTQQPAPRREPLEREDLCESSCSSEVDCPLGTVCDPHRALCVPPGLPPGRFVAPCTEDAPSCLHHGAACARYTPCEGDRGGCALTGRSQGTWFSLLLLLRVHLLGRRREAETTRKRRIQRTQEELEEGQRRPCCWPGCKHRERTGK